MTISFNTVNANLRVPGFIQKWITALPIRCKPAAYWACTTTAQITLNSPMIMPSAEMMQQ